MPSEHCVSVVGVGGPAGFRGLHRVRGSLGCRAGFGGSAGFSSGSAITVRWLLTHGMVGEYAHGERRAGRYGQKLRTHGPTIVATALVGNGGVRLKSNSFPYTGGNGDWFRGRAIDWLVVQSVFESSNPLTYDG